MRASGDARAISHPGGRCSTWVRTPDPGWRSAWESARSRTGGNGGRRSGTTSPQRIITPPGARAVGGGQPVCSATGAADRSRPKKARGVSRERLEESTRGMRSCRSVIRLMQQVALARLGPMCFVLKPRPRRMGWMGLRRWWSGLGGDRGRGGLWWHRNEPPSGCYNMPVCSRGLSSIPDLGLSGLMPLSSSRAI